MQKPYEGEFHLNTGGASGTHDRAPKSRGRLDSVFRAIQEGLSSGRQEFYTDPEMKERENYYRAWQAARERAGSIVDGYTLGHCIDLLWDDKIEEPTEGPEATRWFDALKSLYSKLMRDAGLLFDPDASPGKVMEFEPINTTIGGGFSETYSSVGHISPVNGITRGKLVVQQYSWSGNTKASPKELYIIEG